MNSFRYGLLLLVLHASASGCGDARPGRPAGDGGGGVGGDGGMAVAGSGGGGGQEAPPADFSAASRVTLSGDGDFGRSVDLLGDRLAVGGLPMIGVPAVRIYERSGTDWSEIMSASPQGSFQYDIDVDLGGNHLGVLGDSAAEVYTLGNGGWSSDSILVLSPVGTVNALASDDNRLVLASSFAFTPFVVQESAIPPDGEEKLVDDISHGCSLDVDGDTAIVGSCLLPMGGNPPGKAFVYRRSGGTWALQQTLTPSDGLELFGSSVSLSGDVAVIGGVEAGYVFRRDPTGLWSEEARLRPDDDDARGFGHAVATSAGVVLVGAPQTTFLIATFDVEVGAVYVFAREDGSWRQQTRLEPEMPEFLTGFGTSVAVENETAVVGEPGHRKVNVFTAK